MHKQISLSIASFLALATVLLVGCKGRQQSPAESRKEKINTILHTDEVKLKVDTCKTLIEHQLQKQGLAQNTVQEYLGVLDELYEEACQAIKSDPNMQADSLPSKQDMKKGLHEYYTNLKLRIGKINSRRDLSQLLVGFFDCSIEEMNRALARLGISDADIVVLRDMFLDDQFMDQLIDTFVDWGIAFNQQLMGV